MSNGHLRTFDEWGWSSSLSASAQRVAVQAALDSAEPLLMPRGETVQIDAPLVFNYPTRLCGAGSDITDAAVAASQFRCGVSGVPMLQIRSSNVRLENFNVHADAPNCEGIVIGDGVTTRGAIVLDGLTTCASMRFGVHFLSGTNCALRNCWLAGSNSALLVENRANADEGDNFISGSKFYTPAGIGLQFLSGGGLYIGQSKFISGVNHISMNWNAGGSGNLTLTGCSLESCTGISFDIQGAYDFKRMEVVGNTWGGIPSVALAVRNYSATNWLKDLLVAANTFDTYGPTPMVDIGCTDNAFITGNTFRGNNLATPGIMTRNGTGAIGTNRFTDCAVPVQNDAGWAMAGQL